MRVFLPSRFITLKTQRGRLCLMLFSKPGSTSRRFIRFTRKANHPSILWTKRQSLTTLSMFVVSDEPKTHAPKKVGPVFANWCGSGQRMRLLGLKRAVTEGNHFCRRTYAWFSLVN